MLLRGMSNQQPQSRRDRRARDVCENGSQRARQIASAKRMCRNVASFTDPFTLECWASTFLGKLWRMRDSVDYDDGWPLILGEPIVETMAHVGGRGAKAALMALSRLDRTILGVVCADLARELTDVALPHWFDQVAAIEVTRAAWASKPKLPGEMVLIGANRAGRETLSLLVAIDPAQDGVATHLLTTRPFDDALERFAQQAAEQARPFPFKAAEPAFVCRRAEAAMRRTDASPLAEVHELYGDVRAVALNYIHQVIQPRVIRNGLSADS